MIKLKFNKLPNTWVGNCLGSVLKIEIELKYFFTLPNSIKNSIECLIILYTARILYCAGNIYNGKYIFKRNYKLMSTSACSPKLNSVSKFCAF